tara:strand:- start:13681 stop:14223 length:543 start_codon:yes stop_codon:yes gene_type:complete
MTETARPSATRSRVTMKIDVVPIPTGASLSNNIEKRAAQERNINQIKTLGRDLFEGNNAIVTEQGSSRLYQTADLYSESLSIEKLIPMLTSNDLTLRLNAVRSGIHSSSTCMELKSGTLADIVQKIQADERNEKTTSVSIPTSKEAGKMFIGVKLKGGNHFIQKLDYEISGDQDDKLHVE